jgi:osmotically inducible protein OsmC
MATENRAEVTWKGSLIEGGGAIHDTSSGKIGTQEISWKARAEDQHEQTNPEELIAAAHAACFSMALSHGLAQDSHAPEQLDTSATVTFVPGEGITKIALTVRGRVPGMAAEEFEQAAQAAKENCPVSKALAGVPEITLDAELES